jgi:hypothetical protein
MVIDTSNAAAVAPVCQAAFDDVRREVKPVMRNRAERPAEIMQPPVGQRLAAIGRGNAFMVGAPCIRPVAETSRLAR